MRTRLAALFLAVLALLAACGGDDDAPDEEPSTSTTAATASTTTVPDAEPASVARFVLQFDDQLRPKVATARACIHGPHEQCQGAALDAYDDIPSMTSAISDFLPQLGDEQSQLYYGPMSGDLTGRLDETINAGAAAASAARAAIDACLPDFPRACDEANEALDAALIELFKVFNDWRELA